MIEKIKERVSELGIVKKCLVILLALSILITVIFIFSNSMKSPTQSTADSDAVKDFVSDVIAPVIPPESDLGQTIIKNIRKIAHFTEYGLLAIESALLIALLARKRGGRYKFAGLSVLEALIVAFFDETIQIFSKRGPAIADVWLDVGGFVTYTALTLLCFELVLLCKFAVLKIKDRINAKK